MKDKWTLELEIDICDRNRNFGEISEGILQTIRERDGVEKLRIIGARWKKNTNHDLNEQKKENKK